MPRQASRLIRAIESALSAARPAAVPGLQPDLHEAGAPADRAQMQKLCQQLADLLASSNAEAGVLIENQAEPLRAALGKGYAGLRDLVQNFDLSEALNELRRLAGTAHIELN